MFRTASLFSRTLSTAAKSLKKRVWVVDIDTTAGQYGTLVKHTFKYAFDEHGLKVEDKDILPEMGMKKGPHIRLVGKKPRVYSQWLEMYPAEVKAKLDLEPYFERHMERTHRTFEEKMEQCAHLISPIPAKMEIYRKLRGCNPDELFVLNSGFYWPVVEKILPSYYKHEFYPRMVVTASDVQNGRPEPDMLDKIMKDLKIDDPAELVVVGDGYQDILAGKNLAKLYHGRTPWTVLDLTHSAQLNVESENQKENDPKLVQQRTEIIRDLLDKTSTKLRPDFIVTSSDALLKVQELITDRMKHGIRPGEQAAMIVQDNMTQVLEQDLGYQIPAVPPLLRFR